MNIASVTPQLRVLRWGNDLLIHCCRSPRLGIAALSLREACFGSEVGEYRITQTLTEGTFLGNCR